MNSGVTALFVVVAITLFTDGTLAADSSDCRPPEPPTSIPNGSTATKGEMVSAKRKLEAYNAAMNSYLACDEKAVWAAPADQRNSLTSIHNARVDELQTYVSCFNSQIEVYKSTGGGNGGGIARCPSTVTATLNAGLVSNDSEPSAAARIAVQGPGRHVPLASEADTNSPKSEKHTTAGQTHSYLTISALAAAAQLARSYKPKDQFDRPPVQEGLVGQPFAVELMPRESGFNKGCGFFASWSYDASKGELEIGAMPGMVFADRIQPSGAFPDISRTDQLNAVAFVCSRVAQSEAKANNAYGASTIVNRSTEESQSFSTSNVQKPYWTVHIEGREARELAKAVRIRMTGVLGEWRPGQVVICYREFSEATFDFPFERITRDCMFKTDSIRFEIVDSRTNTVLYAWD